MTPIDRRRFCRVLGGPFAAATALAAVRWSDAAHAAGAAPVDAGARLRDIERRSGGRLGVCLVDTASGTTIAHRADERFLMCSTFKLMAAALVLRRVDLGLETLDRVVTYGPADLVPYSPVTAARVAGAGMRIGDLCAATITTSDNTAAILILRSYGGPAALTAFLRSIGDDVTRLDRFEPEVNLWQAGDLRDTTSPRAMLASMQRVTLGDVLQPASRDVLLQWLRANTTGATRLRAGVPVDWRVADKTGASDSIVTTSNDIGLLWPPQRAPWLVTAYVTESRASLDVLAAAIADVAALAAEISVPISVPR